MSESSDEESLVINLFPRGGLDSSARSDMILSIGGVGLFLEARVLCLVD